MNEEQNLNQEQKSSWTLKDIMETGFWLVVTIVGVIVMLGVLMDTIASEKCGYYTAKGQRPPFWCSE